MDEALLKTRNLDLEAIEWRGRGQGQGEFMSDVIHPLILHKEINKFFIHSPLIEMQGK